VSNESRLLNTEGLRYADEFARTRRSTPSRSGLSARRCFGTLPLVAAATAQSRGASRVMADTSAGCWSTGRKAPRGPADPRAARIRGHADLAQVVAAPPMAPGCV